MLLSGAPQSAGRDVAHPKPLLDGNPRRQPRHRGAHTRRCGPFALESRGAFDQARFATPRFRPERESFAGLQFHRPAEHCLLLVAEVGASFTRVASAAPRAAVGVSLVEGSAVRSNSCSSMSCSWSKVRMPKRAQSAEGVLSSRKHWKDHVPTVKRGRQKHRARGRSGEAALLKRASGVVVFANASPKRTRAARRVVPARALPGPVPLRGDRPGAPVPREERFRVAPRRKT